MGEPLRLPGVFFLGDGDFLAVGEAFLGEAFFGDLPFGVTTLRDTGGAVVVAVASGSIGVALGVTAFGDFFGVLVFEVTALGDLASGVGVVLDVTVFGDFWGVFTGVLALGDFFGVFTGVLAFGVTALGDLASGVGVVLDVTAFGDFWGVFTGVLALGDFAGVLALCAFGDTPFGVFGVAGLGAATTEAIGDAGFGGEP